MTDSIILFPNSKRKLTEQEQRLVSICANTIHNNYKSKSPFIKESERVEYNEEMLRELIRNIFALNED